MYGAVNINELARSAPIYVTGGAHALNPRAVFVHVATPDLDLLWGMTGWPSPTLRCWDCHTGRLVSRMPPIHLPYTLLPIMSASSDWLCIGASSGHHTLGTLVLNLNEYFHHRPEHCCWTALAPHDQSGVRGAGGMGLMGGDPELLSALLASGRLSVGPREVPWMQRRLLNADCDSGGAQSGRVDLLPEFDTPWLGEDDFDTDTQVRWSGRGDTRNTTRNITRNASSSANSSSSPSLGQWRFLELLDKGARTARMRSLHVLTTSAQIAANFAHTEEVPGGLCKSQVMFAGLVAKNVCCPYALSGNDRGADSMVVVMWKDTPVFLHPLGLRLLLQKPETDRTRAEHTHCVDDDVDLGRC